MTMLKPEGTPSVGPDIGPEERQIFTAGGGDWDDVLRDVADAQDDHIIVNMGPQHPSTHGVLRLILEIDGEG